jgi:hypothetical protein
MTDSNEKQCPRCGQQLRFPKNIGGVLMACPSCGNKFYMDFKLGGTKRIAHRGIMTTIFEMPNEIMMRIWRYFTS